MKNTYMKFLFLFPLCGLILSCSKEEDILMEEAFVHIMVNETSEIQVNSNRRDVVSYYIYFSTAPTTQTLEVDYSVIAGEGLQEGRDYELITRENPMAFPAGIYQRPIQIRWLERRVDPAMDNTLTIQLEGNNLGVTTGFPGPDARQSALIITKVNN